MAVAREFDRIIRESVLLQKNSEKKLYI